MKTFIKKILKESYRVYLSRLGKEENIKKENLIKPFIFNILDNEKFDIYLINLVERNKGVYNKNIVESDNKFLNNLSKYDIDLLGISENGLLWGEFIHEVIPTKKNNKVIMLSMKGRNYVKSIYGKIGVESFIKKLFSMGNRGGKTLFIDSSPRFKNIEKRLMDGLFNLSNIPNVYYVDKKNNTIYMTLKKTSMINLLNMMGIDFKEEDIKIVSIFDKDKLKEEFYVYLSSIYGKNSWKQIEVSGSFLNSYSNLKDVSNMIEGPNDIFQDWLKRLLIPYDDQYIKRIIIDDIITDSKLEGFFLYYKNMWNKYKLDGFKDLIVKQ